jgi:hypothetical protein
MLKKLLSINWHTEVAEKCQDAKNFSTSVSFITLPGGHNRSRLKNAHTESEKGQARDHLRRHARDPAQAMTAGRNRSGATGNQSGGEEPRRDVCPRKKVRKCRILNTDRQGAIGGQKMGPEFPGELGIHEIELINRGRPESL